MRIETKLREVLETLMNSMHEKRKLILALSCVVVFMTTYVLILPAFTLEKDEAAEQGGIDLPATEAVAEVETESAEETATADDETLADDSETPAAEAKTAAEDKKSEATSADSKDDPLMFKGEEFSVTVNDKNQEMSDSTRVEVTEILADNKDQAKQYAALYQDALQAVRAEDGDDTQTDITFAKFYNITVLEGDEAADITDKVDVTFSYDEALQEELKAEKTDEVKAVQFSENDTTGQTEANLIDSDEVEVKLNDKKVEEASFGVDNSSVVAIVGTETLSTEVITATGETYEISVTYGPEAGIPEGAELHATEITDEETFNTYMEKAAAEVSENGDNNVLSARFFDVEIRSGGEVIEPKEPVSVSIKYDEQVVLGEEDTMSAIHFGEKKIDVTTVEPVNNDGATEVTFDQDGFSVTGTIITSGVISNGDYYVLYKNGNNYYALANDGSAVQVNVQDGGVVDENERTNIIWRRSGQIWRGVGDTWSYISPANYQAVGNYANLTLTKQDDGTYTIRNGNRYLRYSSGRFTGGSNDSNNHMILAKVDSNTNVKIHYGYLDDSGNYVEWTDKVKTLRSPNMLGDQYDVRDDINGYEYVTSRLGSPTGKAIINLLNTPSGKDDDYNNYHPTNQSVNAVWKYRELTSNNNKYTNYDNLDPDFDYNRNTVLNNDIYVVYRKDPKGAGQTPEDDEPLDADAPKIAKEKQDNGDGTYDIDLSVTGEAASKKKSGRANVVVVLDSSASMSQNNSPKWGLAKNAVQDLSDNLLGLNTATGDNARRVEFAFVNFSNIVKNESWIYSVGPDNKNQHIYTDASKFNSMINSLNTFGGTCWDKAMQAANSVLWDDDDPVYVVFISDGDTNSRAYANGHYDFWDGGTYYEQGTYYNYTRPEVKYNVDSATVFADKIKAKGGTVYTVGITGGGTLENLYRLNQGEVGYVSDPVAAGLHYDVTDAAGINAAFKSIMNDIMSSIGYQDVVMTDGITGMTSTALVNGNAGNFSYIVAKYKDETTEKLTALPEGAAIGSKRDENNNITVYSKNTGSDKDTYPYIKTYKEVESQAKVTENNSDHTVSIRFPDGETDVVNQASYDADSKTVTWNFDRNASDHYQLRDGYTYTVSFTVWPNQASYDLIAALRNGLLEWGKPFKYVDETGTEHTIPASEYTNQIDESTYALKSNTDDGNTVTYYKVSTQTVSTLPAGVGENVPVTDPNTGAITVYTKDQGKDTYTKTVKTPGTQNFVNPEPMPLAGTSLKLTKVWADTLDPSHLEQLIKDAENKGKEYSIELNVFQNGKAYKSYTFKPVKKYYDDAAKTIEAAEGKVTDYYSYTWPPQEVNIAPALLVKELPEGTLPGAYKKVTLKESEDAESGEEYYVLNDGHTYTITETATDFHFVFSANPYHPSLINSASSLSNVVFDTDKDTGAITPDGQAYIDGRAPLERFDAVNSLTSELDITKQILDPYNKLSRAQEDQETFTYKVTLTVPIDTEAQHLYAYEFVPRNDSWDGSTRIYAYGYQAEEGDEFKGLDDDVERFNKQIFGRYTVSYPDTNPKPTHASTLYDMFTERDEAAGTKTGTIYITLKRNEIIRFTNLPLGTQYTIQEIYANLRQADPSKDADAIPSANTEASNIAEQGYTISEINTKNGSPTVSTTDAENDTVSGTITELDKRYYNQYVNKFNLVDTELIVKKLLSGLNWTDSSGANRRFYFTLTPGEATYTDGTASGVSPLPNSITGGRTRFYITQNSEYRGTKPQYSFGRIRYSKAGTYKYTITETDSLGNALSGTTANGITYGKAEEITVEVEEYRPIGGEKQLRIKSITGKMKGTDDTTRTIYTAAVTANPAAGIEDDDIAYSVTSVTNIGPAELQIRKIGDNDPYNVLAGVTFKLYTAYDAANPDNNVEAVNTEGTEIGTITTDGDGIAKVEKLPVREEDPYYLVETGAKDGYKLLTDPVVVYIRTSSDNTGYSISYDQSNYDESQNLGLVKLYKNKTDGSYVYVAYNAETDPYAANEDYTSEGLAITVNNWSGVELPSAGGIGTTIFYIIGTLLLTCSAVVLIARRRMKVSR